MKTYLLIWFSSDGMRPSEVNQRLMSLGFELTQGSYDFEYSWNGGASLDQVLELGTRSTLASRARVLCSSWKPCEPDEFLKIRYRRQMR